MKTKNEPLILLFNDQSFGMSYRDRVLAVFFFFFFISRVQLFCNSLMTSSNIREESSVLKRFNLSKNEFNFVVTDVWRVIVFVLLA